MLVANTGSSSLKLRVVGPSGEVEASADLDPADVDGLREFAAGAAADAVGHRIVHGGPGLREPLVLDAGGFEALRDAADLAPLHNGPALRVAAVLRDALPDSPHVACFDTAFHARMPDAAALYALPREWIERHGLRRLGFHGLSHGWAARRAAELLGPGPLRLVTCHLGAGASATAIRDGKPIDTTMGFTPNEGLVMATRSGSVDPGMLLWLVRRAGLDPEEVEDALEHRSGLAGLGGGSGDMRELLEAAERDDRARTALGVYVHRLRAGVAAMAAALDGLDALVFTGGVGEHAWQVRSEACSGLSFLGVELDPGRNERRDGDQDVAAPRSAVRVLVIESREDLEIARLVRSAL